MREDMAHVIVERPRRWGKCPRKGRNRPFEDLPSHQGMRRPWRESGDYKELNENLQPLRRYLERQVGRPWNKVYSEIASRLRVDSAVQLHVRDHLWDFVSVRVLRTSRWGLYSPLYVDPKDGILKRTKSQITKKFWRRPATSQIEKVPIGPDRELRLLQGIWYEVRLAPLPEPVYRVVTEHREKPLKPHRRSSPTVDVTVTVRRLVTSAVYDVVSRVAILAGPATDDERSWEEYRRNHEDRRYAVSKRTLSRAELRRHGLLNDVNE